MAGGQGLGSRNAGKVVWGDRARDDLGLALRARGKEPWGKGPGGQTAMWQVEGDMGPGRRKVPAPA